MSVKQSVQSQLATLSRGQKVTLTISIAVIAIAVFWIGLNVLPGLFARRAVTRLDTPEQRIVEALNEKLLENPAFLDVGVSTGSEGQSAFVVNGAVHSVADLNRLDQRLKELRPEGDYEVHVEILKK